MPCCRSDGDDEDDDVNLFYNTYGHGPIKILLIIGLAGTHSSWFPQIRVFTGSDIPNDDDFSGIPLFNSTDRGLVQICAFDNRGIGQSSVPASKSMYTTKIMAKDAISILDHLGWEKAHVFGHSLGAMIACKLATMVPERILSLALLNVTGGGFQCFPKLERRTISVAFRFLRARTPEQRAAVDLDTHYTKEYLEEYMGGSTRRSILHQQYVKGISDSGMQSSYGFIGQVNACWTHRMSDAELEILRTSGFLISVIHGRHDMIAQLYYGKKLAEKLYPSARMIDLKGGHLISHERSEEVNEALWELIKASEEGKKGEEWTNLENTEIVEKNDGRFNFKNRMTIFIINLYALLILLFHFTTRPFKYFLKPTRILSSEYA